MASAQSSCGSDTDEDHRHQIEDHDHHIDELKSHAEPSEDYQYQPKPAKFNTSSPARPSEEL
jgi:hypothetical protein